MENETEIKTDDELKKTQGIEEGETILRVTEGKDGKSVVVVRGEHTDIALAFSFLTSSALEAGVDKGLLYAAFKTGIDIYDEKRKGESDEH